MKKTRDGMRDPQITDDILDEAEDIGTSPDIDGSEDQDEGTSTETDVISGLQRELTTERDKYLRLAAEFDNFRKRMMKERLDAEARGQADLVKHMLEPLDDIARFAHVDPAVTASATVVEGVALVEKKLEKSLRTAGLEVVNPVGQKFDPAFHEAVATQPAASEDQDHIVSQVYQVGYTFNGQLLRPARVVVQQYQGSN